MVLAAHRGGVTEELRRELSESQPALTTYLTRSVPDMFGKAYRWVAEMEEIASFTGSEAEETMYDGIAELYERLAADAETDKTEIAALAEFFGKPKS
jgi:L-threonate 2-dehydrogenase